MLVAALAATGLACELRGDGSGASQVESQTSALTVAALSRTGWVATASSTSGSDVASRALDGNTSTRWSSGVNQADGQWFQVDMRSGQAINQVTLNATGSNSDYPRGYQLFVSQDGTTWSNAIATGTGSGALVTINFGLVYARYFKIVQTGTATNWWSIYELNVYGVPPTFAPQVLSTTGWTASASSSSGSDVPSRALDGVITTRWSSGVPQAATGQFFKVDLGTARVFNQIVLDANGTSDYPRGYQVFVSNDNANWGTAVASGAGTSSVVTIGFNYQAARYIKIALTAASSSWWSIYELRVSGLEAAVLSRSGWVASASFVCQTDVAANAIDNDLTTRWSTGIPQANNNQWFQVDMRSPQTFAKVTMNSATSSSDYARGYQLFVSNDGVDFGHIVASGVGTGPMVTITFPVQTARYIRIYQTGSSSSWWSVHDFNVYQAYPIGACVNLVSPDPSLTGTTREVRFQESLLRGCTGRDLPPCEVTLRARMNVDFVTAAARYLNGDLPGGAYAQLLRDREATLQAVHATPSLGCTIINGDADGDFVPNGSDACPNTPPLTPVLANGCTNTQLPPNPAGSADARGIMKYFGVAANPNCVGVPPPVIPKPLGAWRFPSDPTVGKAIWVSREPTVSACPLYYQLETYLTDGSFRSTTFKASEDVTLPWIPRPAGAVQFNVHTTDAGDRGAWANYGVHTHSYRVRAFNGAGARSMWSQFYSGGGEDCALGQPCPDR